MKKSNGGNQSTLLSPTLPRTCFSLTRTAIDRTWTDFHAFIRWYNTFKNPVAGLQAQWGGTGRVCLDWLPFMFSRYSDDKLVDDFVAEENWSDEQRIFQPNFNQHWVRAFTRGVE
jgi:hypothetical protein